ncbi:MAG: prepilin-type N-terminal cleavage/methylation domain-containing protein [Bacillota bacterium]|nr:prepilin-type N-terminal cleavage/methylation domain-containing protein [Bacillota bacterium]MDI7248765.1 prepilin-type N-terminal cleavage/methylation domain-containing protein [Bacillota bacterium]
MKRLQKALKGEKGFTLVELMIVIGIIIILASILIVQWRGARQRAYDSQALSVCRNAAVAAQIYYNDRLPQSYELMDEAALHDIEPSLPDAANKPPFDTYTVRPLGTDFQDFEVLVSHANGTLLYRATKDGIQSAKKEGPYPWGP